MYKAGFIGCGNMGGALLRAVVKKIGGENVVASDFSEEKLSSICSETGAFKGDNKKVCSECEYIFLGVKPQVINKVLSEIAPFLKERKTPFVLVSMAAGVSIEGINDMLGAKYPVIRIMPNTPCQIGSGIVLYSPCDLVKEEKVREFASIMEKAGLVDRIEEKMIDGASAISGCGPAFCYMFIEALSDGGCICGLPRDKAVMYASQMLKGASELVLSSKNHPGELKDAVCSPGGTTIEGVRALEKGKFRSDVIEAVVSAYEKTLKLKK